MTEHRLPATGVTRWTRLGVLTAIYVLAGKLGLLFTFVHASASPIWPPTGIALAAFLLFGRSVWPAVAVGAFVVNVTTAGSVVTSLGIALGNTLEGILAAGLVARVAGGVHAFDRARHVFGFAVAAGAGVVVSATVGVATLTLAGYAPRADVGVIWLTWALGDLAGALIIAPAVILWAADQRVRPWLERPIELAGLVVALVVVAVAVFGGLSPTELRQYPLAFMAIPSLLWAAFRFGRQAAATAVVVLAGIALHGTLRGFGPFAVLPPTHSLLVLQAFTSMMALMTLVVAALAWNRERERALLQTIIDRIPVMITMYQPDTRVLRLNQEFERLTGWSMGEARQVDLMERCYPDPAYRDQMRAFMESLQTGWLDVTLTTKAGERIETSWSNIRLPDNTRIGIGLDVRERRRVEAERERVHAEAAAQSRAKDEFFAMLGHELRNPLGAITSALYVIELCGPLDPRSDQARGIITRQVRHLVRLVDDLLDVTRLTTGRITLALQPVELTAVVRRVVDALRGTAPARRLECGLGEPVWIDADETRLEQILMNLLGNAMKFTPADGLVTVEVGAEGGHAVLRVADTGAGIAPELLPRVFDLFVQGHTGLHRRESGLGIGLTLTRRLVDLHGGRIEAASEGPGRGSVFTVRFPLIEHPVPARADESAAARSTGRRRVLIIEDNADARRMLRHLLEGAGHEVHEADEGISGLERALALAPDAAVVDIGLPGLDGYAIARQLRQDGRADMLLIAVTGYGQPEDRLRSREAGFHAHLTKPVDPDALEALLAGSTISQAGDG